MIAHHDDICLAPIRSKDIQKLRMMDLPNEILLSVLSFMNVESLITMKLVCRHFDDMVDQFLYQNPKILRGTQARKLDTALHNKPTRANWVRDLLVSTKFGDDYGLPKLPPHIPHMRNLESLRLETPDCNSRKPDERTNWIRLQNSYERVFEQASLRVSKEDRLLPLLKKCTLHFVDDRAELYSLTRYASLFLHPNLKSLTISCSSTNTPDELHKALRYDESLQRSTDLEHLHLEECDVHGPSLALLLTLPRALKSFKFSEGTRYDGFFRSGSRRMHGNIKPNHLMSALKQTSSDTLESLSLMLGHRRHPMQSISDNGQHLNMTAMTKLRHLEVDDKTLLLLRPRPGCDHSTWLRFPPNLESLKVTNIRLTVNFPFEQRREPYVPLETCFIKDKAKHGVPNLTTVTFSYEFADDDDEFNELDEFLLMGPENVDAHLPLPNNFADVEVHPPQPPSLDSLTAPFVQSSPEDTDIVLPPDLIANLNAVDPGNLDQAQQFIRQHLFTHANRTRQAAHRTAPQREFTHLELTKIALLRTLNNDLLPSFRQSNVRLMVDMVKLPRGFIPPYLYPEDKPTTQYGWWDSNAAKEAEVYMREVRLIREARIFERNMRSERERRRREEMGTSDAQFMDESREQRMTMNNMADFMFTDLRLHRADLLANENATPWAQTTASANTEDEDDDDEMQSDSDDPEYTPEKDEEEDSDGSSDATISTPSNRYSRSEPCAERGAASSLSTASSREAPRHASDEEMFSVNEESDGLQWHG